MSFIEAYLRWTKRVDYIAETRISVLDSNLKTMKRWHYQNGLKKFHKGRSMALDLPVSKK